MDAPETTAKLEKLLREAQAAEHANKRKQMFREFRARGGVVALLVGGVFLIVAAIPKPPVTPPVPPPASGALITKDYFVQVANEANKPCSNAIEKMALYDDVRWTGISYERFRSGNKYQSADGTLELGGDDAEMQNGIGNWVRVYYVCNYNPATKEVINVKVNRGRLPW